MDIVARGAIAYLFILFLTRAVGRRELSTLEPIDLILLVVLGDLIQQGVTQNDFSVTGMALAAGTIAAMTVIFSFANVKLPWARPFLEGEPVILVQHGEVIEKNLRRERITEAELAAQARAQQVARIEDVDWAVLETSGQISIIPKQ